MQELQNLAQAQWPDDDWRSHDERLPSELSDALNGMQLHDMGRFDVDNFASEYSVTRSAETVRIWTDESEVQGFLKLLLHYGAKVEVFSRHDWDEATGGARDANDRSNRGSD
jgi:hypothetical protein